MKALTFSRFGGPDVLEYIEVPDPRPAPGQALLRLQAIGLNFADVYRRQGRYHLRGAPPYIAGYEGAGVIVEAPPGSGFAAGDRVGFADAPFANAELVAVDVERLIRLPDAITAETAAALLLQGLTAQFLASDSHALQAGERALVHAAAGGVGGLLMQLGRARGASMLGLVSSEAKAQGLREQGFEVLLQAPAAGADLDVVYDSTGTTVLDSLQQLRSGGTVVFYGMAGGPPPAVDPRILMDGSKRLVGGDLWNVLSSAEQRQRRADELFALVAAGALRVPIAARFTLAEGARAHALLEARGTVGKLLLLP
ncbi:quinone oxidoreductase family protein [Roseateles violae]|uniref:Quinone oxidoreductase n=1 Tax=Roseateles violae TaxID=3058042 RepID=A0ABT8DYM3_9BURK|nr:quinone oxidoreductase [Pelomonas sp. PFR6]MDN3922685.1 quinone oxidoreductase [Pelomonas sp. PFR6]